MRPSLLSSCSSSPLLRKRIIQPYMRISAFVQKGITTKSMTNDFFFAGSLAIK